jgi:hypothetical protein
LSEIADTIEFEKTGVKVGDDILTPKGHGRIDLLRILTKRGGEDTLIKLIDKLPSKEEFDYSRIDRIDQALNYLLSDLAVGLGPKGLRILKQRISDHSIKTNFGMEVKEKEERIEAVGAQAIEKFIAGEEIRVEDFNKWKVVSAIKGLDGENRTMTQMLHAALDEFYAPTYHREFHNASREAWLESSSSSFSAALKDATARQFGGTVRYHREYDEGEFESDLKMIYGKHSKEFVDEYVVRQKNLTKVLLDIKYPDSKDFLLYRGTCEGEISSDDIEEEYKEEGSVECVVRSNPVSSWSMKEEVAAKFAKKYNGAIVSIKVPKEDVWSCFLTHSHSGFEHEFIVLGHEDRIGKAKLKR